MAMVEAFVSIFAVYPASLASRKEGKIYSYHFKSASEV